MVNSLTNGSRSVALTTGSQIMMVTELLHHMDVRHQETMGTRKHLLGRACPVDLGWEVECKLHQEDKAEEVEEV